MEWSRHLRKRIMYPPGADGSDRTNTVLGMGYTYSLRHEVGWHMMARAVLDS